MRIAFITVGDTARRTGGYLYHAEVFARLRAEGIEIVEIVAGATDIAAQQAQAALFGEAFNPRPFDVVVVDALACVTCAPSLDGWRAVCPLVAMVHELPSVAGGNADASAEAPLLRADLLIAVSQHGRTILETRGVPPARIRVASPGCDRVGSRQQAAVSTQQEPGITHHNRQSSIVLSVAQWIPRKGLLDLVRAWSSQPRPGARLDLIGETDVDPGYAAQVQAALADAPDSSPVRVRGVVSDAELGRAYQQAALFALPSRYEGYGMVYAEALRHGLPVLACAVGPVPELVGAAGVLVPPGDVPVLSAALGRLLADQALRARLAAAAQARVDALPTWDDTARAFCAALEAAVDGRQRDKVTR